ncbi:uncharacterized protein LOC141913842 [Tubulanus polymorphus]|uniref:uncharacterized protein LOC141913842 n=1 Tax=Tubulanus polymorphus TaxID=672921 RepID=UPI003DA5FB45
MAYRSAVHDSTKFTPNLMFGHEIRLPIDLMYEGPPHESSRSLNMFTVELRERIRAAHDLARHNSTVRTRRMKRNYDTKATGVAFSVGALVWLHNPACPRGMSPKLYHPWDGPWTVKRKVNDVGYEIHRETQN